MGIVHRFQGCLLPYPNKPQSRKYLRLHLQSQSNQFKALLFGLSTFPMEFMMVVKRVKLMARNKAIRIHQHLDEWLVRATSHQTCLDHTQTLVIMCQELGWIVNMEKGELEPKQIVNFIGYQFDLKEGKGRCTSGMLAGLKRKKKSSFSATAPVGSDSSCLDRPFNSYRETGPPVLVPHWANSLAPEKSQADPRIIAKW